MKIILQLFACMGALLTGCQTARITRVGFGGLGDKQQTDVWGNFYDRDEPIRYKRLDADGNWHGLPNFFIGLKVEGEF